MWVVINSCMWETGTKARKQPSRPLVPLVNPPSPQLMYSNTQNPAGRARFTHEQEEKKRDYAPVYAKEMSKAISFLQY